MTVNPLTIKVAHSGHTYVSLDFFYTIENKKKTYFKY